MKEYINGFLLSFSFFSILPIRLKSFESNRKVYQAMLFVFPFVGLVLACITLILFYLLSLFFDPIYAAFVSSCCYLLLYGFLHLEAVCDVIDAWFASLSNKNVYAIMKEPTIGAIGAIATFVLVLLKLAVLISLLYKGHYEYFVVVLMLSRFAMIVSVMIFEFHQGSFIANSLKKSATLNLIILSAVFMISLSYALVQSNLIVLLMGSLLLMISLLNWLKKKFGFLNGDCLGFSLEVCELLILNVALALSQ